MHSQVDDGGPGCEEVSQRGCDAVGEQGVEPAQSPRHPMQGKVGGWHRIMPICRPPAAHIHTYIHTYALVRKGAESCPNPSPRPASASASPMSSEHCDGDTTSPADRNTFPGSKVRVANGGTSASASAPAPQEMAMPGYARSFSICSRKRPADSLSSSAWQSSQVRCAFCHCPRPR